MTNIYITACGKKDGLGSQVSSKILALLFCKKHNYKYFHTPLQILDYIYKGEVQDSFAFKEFNKGNGSSWVNGWENMLNIYPNKYNSLKFDKIIDITNVLKTGQIKMKNNYLWHDFDPQKVINSYNLSNYNNVLFLIKEFPKLNNYSKWFCEPIFNILRNNYSLTPKPELLFNEDKFNIVFHKRHMGPYTLTKNTNLNAENNRVTLNTYYIDLMIELYKKYNNKNIEFWIFSDGDQRYFPEYNFLTNNKAKIKKCDDFDINMMMKTNSKEAFHHFVNADILVTDKSSFGYTAGIYNTNIVIYNPYWDKKYEGWVLKEEILKDL